MFFPVTTGSLRFYNRCVCLFRKGKVSAFQAWSEENKDSLREENPDLSEADLTALAARSYKGLTSDEKQVSDGPHTVMETTHGESDHTHTHNTQWYVKRMVVWQQFCCHVYTDFYVSVASNARMLCRAVLLPVCSRYDLIKHCINNTDSVIMQLIRAPKILAAKFSLYLYINNTNRNRLGYKANNLEVLKCKANRSIPKYCIRDGTCSLIASSHGGKYSNTLTITRLYCNAVRCHGPQTPPTL